MANKFKNLAKKLLSIKTFTNKCNLIQLDKTKLSNRIKYFELKRKNFLNCAIWSVIEVDENNIPKKRTSVIIASKDLSEFDIKDDNKFRIELNIDHQVTSYDVLNVNKKGIINEESSVIQFILEK